MITLLALALLAAAETGQTERELPMPPWAFGVIAIVTFAGLLAVTYLFRNTGTKHHSQSEGS